MKIAKKATLEEIEPRHWERFAKEVNIGAPYLRRRIRQLCEATLTQLGTPDSGLRQLLFESESFTPIADLIADRAKSLLIKAG